MPTFDTLTAGLEGERAWFAMYSLREREHEVQQNPRWGFCGSESMANGDIVTII